jgi:hypothetical protein
MATPLIIYSHQDCELCEKAAGMVTMAGVDWLYQDITEDIDLLRRYRHSIPVLRNQETGKELFWPFEEQEILGLAGTTV